MKAILFITLLFLTITIRTHSQTGGKVFGAAGMTKRTSISATDELLIKAAGPYASQYTTPVELFNSAQAQSKFLSKTAVLPLTNYINYASTSTTGDIAVWLNDSVIGRLSGGATNNAPIKQSTGKVSFATVSGGSSLLLARTTSTSYVTSTSFMNVPELTLSLEANSSYEISFQLLLGIEDSADGCGVGINLSSVTGASFGGLFFGTQTTGVTAMALGDVFDGYSGGFLESNPAYGGVKFDGILTTGSTAPTLYVRIEKTTSGTVSIYVPSFVKATKIN